MADTIEITRPLICSVNFLYLFKTIMLKYIIKRFLNMLIVLCGLVLFTFFLMNCTEGDPATIIALDRYGSQLISPEIIQNLAKEHGLDQPVYTRFIAWLKLLAKGDLGCSLTTGVPVVKEIAIRFPYTFQLASISLIIITLCSVPLGIIAALKNGSFVDRFTQIFAAVKVSVPNFYLAFILISIFSVKLKLLPSFGSGKVCHLIMPVAVLVLSHIGYTTRIVRSSVLEILEAEYVKYAYMRGISKIRILFVHVLRNAAVPIITYLSLLFLMLIEGTIIVETVFAWPGIGKLFQDAIIGRDFTMIQALMLFSGILITLMNFIVDMVYVFINRKISFT